ncbi:sporulation protein YqfC [Salipaludibacillus aurantiacus]|uniref:Sporulation protein YqfC n=1 Tax=Salipaludibacillus aurantiacus TaxID=1601833 RepID=A0A1H9RC76_9BACI|nr:sporulation protein YqfC [Salipaludibacillus aurantiacus]SER70531.1 sporulation protein YqfC [Salipaludibacillus aurantiacus]
MKKFQTWIKKWMVDQMDLPADVVMDLPRLTMVGHLHVYIENHQGVIRFTDKELRLAMTEGQIIIQGEGFIIKSILPEEILLEGIINHIHYSDNLN